MNRLLHAMDGSYIYTGNTERYKTLETLNRFRNGIKFFTQSHADYVIIVMY